MVQNITNFPKNVSIQIDDNGIQIRDHKPAPRWEMFDSMMRAVASKTYWDLVTAMESAGISYDAVIEQCVDELESPTLKMRMWITILVHDIDVFTSVHKMFAESDTGLEIGDEYVDMIRSCGNWGEFYHNMNPKSRFHKHMKRRIRREMKGLPLQEIILGKLSFFTDWQIRWTGGSK